VVSNRKLKLSQLIEGIKNYKTNLLMIKFQNNREKTKQNKENWQFLRIANKIKNLTIFCS